MMACEIVKKQYGVLLTREYKMRPPNCISILFVSYNSEKRKIPRICSEYIKNIYFIISFWKIWENMREIFRRDMAG